MSVAIGYAQALDRKERSRGQSAKLARQRLADKLRIGYGTLENLIRGRVKTVDAAIRDRLQALLIQEIEAEIVRLQHELAMAQASSSHLATEQVGQIEAHLRSAKTLLIEGRAG